MFEDLLQVPVFSRLIDYVGLWSVEPCRFAALCQLAHAMDLKVHVEQGAAPALVAVEKTATPNGKSIAIIKAMGLLMKSASSMGGTSTIQLRRDLRQAAADADVGGILLAIDSPGGTVSGTDDLAAEVKAARKAKPVWAHIEDMGASAAYWLASQAERITANSPTALVGGIGTYQVIHDMSGQAEKEGVKVLVLATGSLKGMGTPGSKVTDEQVAHVQGLVNSVQESFDAAVKKGRGLTNQQLADVRHGGAMMAPQALEKKLIDAIQPLSKTIAEFSRALSGGPRAKVDTGTGGLFSLPMLRRGLPTIRE
jgi:signal peptide peptidase SppA